MNIVQAVKEAFESILVNKLRSALTALGIIIGVAAVIAMLSIGRGAQESVTGSIEGIGTNLLFVTTSTDDEIRNPKPLTLSDAQALTNRSQAPAITQAAPVISRNVELTAAGNTTRTSASGVTPAYAQVRNESMAEGAFITQDQLQGRASVVVLGPDTAQNLFGRSTNLVGQMIRVEGQPFRVIGVLKSKGGSGFGSEDDRILVPLTTAQARLAHSTNRDEVDMIMVQARNADEVTQAEQQITSILRTRHRTTPGGDDFRILTQQSFLETAQTITGIFTIFLGGIAAVSLLVGGIGIMNIMLVSVTERTREIGLRKAVGARRKDIIYQFLAESVVLSLIGGIFGILLGWLISFGISQIAAASETPINPSIGVDTILLATLFSMAVGLFFGLYPANRAASLEPVEALRYE
jgi:putative ABC transport system permease protein